jgi:hypothetical protein
MSITLPRTVMIQEIIRHYVLEEGMTELDAKELRHDLSNTSTKDIKKLYDSL